MSRYLHTAFEREGHDQPLIHRDLKSPNLLLVQPPSPDGEIQVKIADFGLSKDKSFDAAKHTAVRHVFDTRVAVYRQPASSAVAPTGAGAGGDNGIDHTMN
jgi:serine/threonine protein kinase